MGRSSMHVTRTAVHLVVLFTVAFLACAGAQAAPLPDLIVRDFWDQGGTIHFTLENIGDKLAPAGHTAYLSVDDTDVDTAYVGVTIAPGKTYAGSFPKYSWECTASGKHTLAVRADGTDKVPESNENNNSREEIWTCDLTPPVITAGPTVGNITSASARVSWTTNESSDSVVRYGQTPGQYSYSRSSQQMTTAHALDLDSLQPDTLYFFVVLSTDGAGNTVQSKEQNFRTQATQKLPDLIVSEIKEQDHRISCTVKNIGAGSAGPGHNAGLYVDGHLVDTATVTVGLAPGASTQVVFAKYSFTCSAPQYTLRAVADTDNSLAESDETNNAMTKVLTCDVTAPKIVSGPIVRNIATTSATILWQTDEASDSVVRYGLTPGQYSFSKSSGQMITAHALDLDGLQSDTLYYFVVQSSDAAGNGVESKENSFRTQAVQQKPPDLVIVNVWVQENQIHFQVRNTGDGKADGGHRTGLYIADRLIDTAAVTQTLAPGESIEGVFAKFYFQCFDAQNILQVVADIEEQIPEKDEGNNALEKTINCNPELLRITSGPSAQSVSTNSAAIVWETNKAADSTVQYDDHARLFRLKATDQSRVTEHRLNLQGLTPGTVYQFKVLSTDAGQSVSSRPMYFRTRSTGGARDARIAGVDFHREDTASPSYKMEAAVPDDTGVDKVEFYVDGALFYTDYSPPYDTIVAPGTVGRTMGEFFDPHPVEARTIVDGGSIADRMPGLFEPAYECNEINAEFDWPFPNETFYVPGDEAPAGTEIPIRVDAVSWFLHAFMPTGIEHLPGAPDILGEVVETPVLEVRFYVGGVHIGTVPSDGDRFYETTWVADGNPTGTYTLRADAVAGNDCIQTITREIRLRHGEIDLRLTRKVWREDHAFRIQLTIRNEGTLDYPCDVIHDNLLGLYAVPETCSEYEVIPQATASTAACDVLIDAFDGGASTRLIRSGRSFVVEYHAVPALSDSYPGWAHYPIGRDPVEITSSGGTDSWSFDCPCTRTEDGILLSDELDTTVEQADFLIVTNPTNCQTEFGSADAVLGQMATLAYHRNGLLGVLDNMAPSGLAVPSESSIRDQIISWGGTMSGGDYLSSGYLLLVGETEIVPSWTINITDVTWGNADPTTEVRLADLPYADTAGDDFVPELIIGRIIGDSSGALVQAMQASLDSTFDRSFGVVTTGSERPSDTFVNWAWEISDVWTGQAAGGDIMTGDNLLHHWTAYVHKEEMVSGFDFPIAGGDGFLMANLGALTALRLVPGSDTVSGAGTGDLELVHTDYSEEFSCPFDAGDALAAGDVDGDGEDEIVIASMSRDELAVPYDPPHSEEGSCGATDLDLSSGDLVACGQVYPGGAAEIVVARTHGADRIGIYQYENMGVPSVTLHDSLDIPFAAGDRLAVGDVNGANAGDEIIVSSSAGVDIRVYDSGAHLLGVIPCETVGANDGLVAGDLDGDGSDEIALMHTAMEVDKHVFVTYDSDCWAQEPNGTWTVKRDTSKTVRSRFLNFDGSTSAGVACCDFDGDGKDEICVAHDAHDRLYVYDAHYSDGWKSRYMPVLQGVDQDTDLLVLCGHGNSGSCSPFSIADVDTLSFDAHPFVLGLSCLTGNYEGNGDDGIAEHFLSSGASVYLGSTEVSSLAVNRALGPDFFAQWETDGTAGQVFRDMRRDCIASADNYTKLWGTEYNFYGDPKFGAAGASGVASALGQVSVAAAPMLPELNVPIAIPDYEVTTTDGVSRVTIPGGSILLEYAQPMVPYYTARWELPSGSVVQDVQLRRRSGLKTQVGLVLPIATMMVDTNEVEPPVQPEPGWYPRKDLEWQLIQNHDRSTTLVVHLYPFFYNSLTTEARFYQEYTLDAVLASSDTRIVWLSTEKLTYAPGEMVAADMRLYGGGPAQDVIVDVSIRQYGSDEVVAGLLLRQLGGLSGPASFAPAWDSAGASPGHYCVDATLVNAANEVLDRQRYLFEIAGP